MAINNLLSSLISHWTLDEASGIRNDVHNANHLADNNTVTQAAGKIGNAGQFGASGSEFLSIADNALLSTGDIDFTASAWVYFDTRNAHAGIVSKTGNGNEWVLYYDHGDQTFVFYLWPGGGRVTWNTIPLTGQWYFVVAWHDSVANTMNLQMNDGIVRTVSYAGGSTDTSAPFRIGRYSTFYWDGRIDSVSFWKRVLTSGERTNLYNSGNGLAYPFNDYLLRVTSDWNSITGADEFGSLDGDITHLVKEYSISRGRSSELDRVGAGRATLVLDNVNGTFLPLNTSSSISGSVLPGRDIEIQWWISGSLFPRFTGKTTSYTPEPTVSGERDVIIECVDAIEGFQRRETRSVLHTGIRSGCLINSILDNAEFPSASRAIDDGQDIYEYAHFDRRKIDEVLVDINQTEYGTIFIRGDGYFIFHDRYYRSKTIAVSSSFNNNMTGINYKRDANDLKTEARVSILPKVKKGETVIWTMQDPVSISPSSTASFFGNYIDPTTCLPSIAISVASPTIGIDALLNSNTSGTGTNLSSDFTACLIFFAESFKTVASNGGATTGYITKFNISGCPIVSYEHISRSYINIAACAQYGVRTLSYDAPLITKADKGQNLADFLGIRYSDPNNIDRISMTIMNSSQNDRIQIVDRELDDRIAVTNDDIKLTGTDFFIGNLDEGYTSRTDVHTVTWILEKLGTGDGFFLVDSSVVGGTKGLGY